MIDSEKRAYRGTLTIFAVVLGVIFIAGVVGDQLGHDRSNFEKAEGLIEDLSVMTANIPRLPDGTIVRQGPLSAAWLDDVGALPARLQAMPGSLRGRKGQHSLGLVRRAPWANLVTVEAKGSLIWTTLTTVPRAVCEQLVRAIATHRDQISYITTYADPPMLPGAMELNWVCRATFLNFTLITLDPPTEFRRLSEDIQNSVGKIPANSTDKLLVSGSSAPFQVSKSQEGSPGYFQNGPSGLRGTVANVPLAVCRLALMAGPHAFGMDSFESFDGKARTSPETRAASDAFCNALGGSLIFNRGSG
jgi:hypothetical protein